MSRRDIHYWKCDRPAAFFGTLSKNSPTPEMEQQLRDAIEQHFQPDMLQLTLGCGQGNHLTWNAQIDGKALFIRVENGPENDDYLEMESAVLKAVADIGVRVPAVHGCDATRTQVPFAWQALERLNHPDLNHWYKQGVLDSHQVSFEIGRNIACWQLITPPGFGPFDLDAYRATGQLRGLHADYATWFTLRLDQHLEFLTNANFLTAVQRDRIASIIREHENLLRLEQGCLVHKDMALWNILGEPNRIAAFIDFDDAISGDPLDDLALLACFHDSAFLARAVAGYESIRPLPAQFRRRLWLHLLRNMIVKAVIRVGSGYFDRDGGLFLIGPNGNGQSLRKQTEYRIETALTGLQTNAELSTI
jgi:fructosamine-3-kinase